MNNLHKFALISLSLASRLAFASDDMFGDMFQEMHNRMTTMHQHMQELWSSFDTMLEESRAQIPIIKTDAQSLLLNVNYDDEATVHVSIDFPAGSLEEVDAEANEKRNTIKISVPSASGTITLTVDRGGIALASEQKIEKKTKTDDNQEETSHISYQSQSMYRSFEVPVDAAKGEVTIKGDSLIINLPREQAIKKINVTRKAV